MEKLLTTQELAEILQCHPQSVYKNRELTSIKIPGIGIRYKESDLNKYIEQKTIRIYSLLIPQDSSKSFNLTKLGEFDKLYLKKNKGGKSGSMKGKKIRWNYGFGSVYIRKTKEGKVRWYAEYYSERKRTREVIKNAQSRAEAVLYLQEKVAEAFNHVHGTQEKKPMSFLELSGCYLKDYAKLYKKSWKADLSRLETSLKPFFGRMKLNEISPFHIEKYRAERLGKGVSKSTINRELALMKKMYNLAIDWKFLTENPVNRIKFFSEKENFIERILTKEEEDRLLGVTSDHLKPILIVALNTGMRKGEILNLKWRQIDLSKKFIKVEKTKSERTRYISINSEVSNLLDKLRKERGKEEFVFTNPETGKPFADLKNAFRGACRRANIRKFRFHDLRHTFASRLVERGVNLITVKELLGHSTVKMTERYTHPNQSLKKNAVELLVQKTSKKPGDLTHICHIERTASDKKSVSGSFSIN
ncbi:tyrosine-type recombinase/integrase [Acidobacteriota bacterium]